MRCLDLKLPARLPNTGAARVMQGQGKYEYMLSIQRQISQYLYCLTVKISE